MKKVTALVASARKKNIYKAGLQLLNNLQSLGDMEGEEFCPLKDAEKGWLESDYFYLTRLRPLKRAAGKFFDQMAPIIRRMFA